MSLLIPETGLLFWMVLTFGIAFFVLAKFGFPIILKSIEQRKAFIADSVNSAKEANEKLTEIKHECDALLQNAKQQHNSILNEAMLEKERILSDAKVKAEKETQKIVDSAMNQIRLEKVKAIRDVRAEIATLSIAVAEKVIRSKVDNESGQKEVLNRLIDEITISKS